MTTPFNSKGFFDKALFDNVRITIASPEKILKWSYGEVSRPETINYRTYKPERDGLFCARIFGPVKDYECLCGKYKKIKYKGIICEKCDVEVTKSSVRRERMAHIKLVTPIVHTWFLHSLPSRIGMLLGIQLKEIISVIQFVKYIVTDSGNTPLNKCTTLTEEEYEEALTKFGDSFKAKMGAEGIRDLLAEIDLVKEKESANKDLTTTSSVLKRTALIKRIAILDDFIKSGNRPEWMVLNVLPVLPPELRPLVMLDAGKFASSDLNELYKRIINRNDRLRKLQEFGAPEIIVRNEKRMLQEAVDALFDNGRNTKVAHSSGRLYKSLSTVLSGKQGRFRQNLLGKRVDYSGRSVIVVGPSLQLHQCGLPKIMALELFKPFVYAKLELYGLAQSIKSAKALVDAQTHEVWEILEEVVSSHPVLLNRAPTLHRLGIQAFEPILIESKAIQLHPLVCVAFNADFDGDQMAVHVPLSIESRMEAKILMMSSANILSPSSGEPIITPTQDAILGMYYISHDLADAKTMNTVFTSADDIEKAIVCNMISINSRIKFLAQNPKKKMEVYDTTPGRVKIFSLLPQSAEMYFESCNKLFTKSDITSLFNSIYKICPPSGVVRFANDIMRLGFEWSTKSGVSICKDDMVVPQTKDERISTAFGRVKEYEKQFNEGYITAREKYNKVTDIWHECTDQVASDMMVGFKKNYETSQINSIYMIAHSGARGSVTQIKQLAGMRGLMVKTSGEILETPILSNFKEGLTIGEYFNSAHGARKGLADTALKTADAGYLTRRLVDVAQNCVILSHDCGTQNGITASASYEDGRLVRPLADIIFGRVLAKDVIIGDKKILKSGTLLVRKEIDLLAANDIQSIEIRSVAKCQLERGVCAMCYGKDVISDEIVNVGQAVGIIAAQSIGEPGTQLTMRTFHVGGVALKTIDKPFVASLADGKIVYERMRFVTNKKQENIVVSHSGYILVEGQKGDITRHMIPYGAKLSVVDGGDISKGKNLAEINAHTTPIIAEYAGKASFKDFVKGVSYQEKFDESTGVSGVSVVESNLHPGVKLTSGKQYIKNESGNDVVYYLPVGANILVENGATINIGDVVANLPKTSQKNRDITGGLPRVVDLFEARKPKSPEIISPFDGTVSDIKSFKAKKKIVIKGSGDDEIAEFSIPGNVRLSVHTGSIIHKGDALVFGEPNPYDILAINGVDALLEYMLKEIQSVYQLQGVKIDNKHIEVIIRYMLQKFEITDAGDTTLLKYQKVTKSELLAANTKAVELGGRPCEAQVVLQGITKSALQTDSFISAASFQETAKVLTDAAISGKIDPLLGIKENVVVGRMVPVGTYQAMKEIMKEVEGMQSTK